MTRPVEAAPRSGKGLAVEATMSKPQYVLIDLELAFRNKGIYLTLSGLLGLSAVALATGLYWLLLPWFLLGALLVINPFLAIRNALSRRNANFFLPCRYSFNQDGVSAETSAGQGTVLWTDFMKWQKVAGHYILHVRGQSFLAIPKAAFSQQDATAFEALLRERIGGWWGAAVGVIMRSGESMTRKKTQKFEVIFEPEEKGGYPSTPLLSRVAILMERTKKKP